MKQTMASVSARKTWISARAATATVADVIRPPLTTVSQHDHVAAAAYLMKHMGTTALMVVDARTGKPAGIITETDVAHAIADGKDVNDVWVDAVMTARPAVLTTTSVRDAARIMTTRRFRHLPVAGGTGLLGLVDLIDVCRALISASQGLPEPGGRSGQSSTARPLRSRPPCCLSLEPGQWRAGPVPRPLPPRCR